MVQFWRIHLPIQETQVWSLVWENPTRHGAAKPVLHSHWNPCALEPVLHNERIHPQCKVCAQQLESSNAHPHPRSRPPCIQRRPSGGSKDAAQPKNKTENKMILVGYLISESSELNSTNLSCSLTDFGWKAVVVIPRTYKMLYTFHSSFSHSNSAKIIWEIHVLGQFLLVVCVWNRVYTNQEWNSLK